MNIQPVHLMGVSVKVIWATSQGPCGEHWSNLRCLQYYSTWSNWS